MTDRELAERAAKRDPKAFGRLYDLYIDKIYKYIYYKCRSVEEAEDLTAQVFTKAWEAIGRYQWEGYPFSTWLYRIAHNQIIDYYRTHHKVLPLDGARTRAGDFDPVEAVERNLTSAEIRDALQHLTRDQQRVIVLRFLEGYEIPEIAAIMGKDSSAIRALQHRALRALQPWVIAEAPARIRRLGRAAAEA